MVVVMAQAAKLFLLVPVVEVVAVLCLIQQSAAECESNDFTCDDGECVRARRFCDGEQDCDDGSDERPGCTPIATTDPPSTLSSGNASAASILGRVVVIVVLVGIVVCCTVCGPLCGYCIKKQCMSSSSRTQSVPAVRRSYEISNPTTSATIPGSSEAGGTWFNTSGYSGGSGGGHQAYSTGPEPPPPYTDIASFPPIRTAPPVPQYQSNPWPQFPPPPPPTAPTAPPHPTPSEAPPPYTLSSAPPPNSGHTPNDVIVPLQTLPSVPTNQDDPPPYSALPIDSTVM